MRSQQLFDEKGDNSSLRVIDARVENVEEVGTNHSFDDWEEISSSVGSFIHPNELTIRKAIFFFFFTGNFWLAFDNGIIPAC